MAAQKDGVYLCKRLDFECQIPVCWYSPTDGVLCLLAFLSLPVFLSVFKVFVCAIDGYRSIWPDPSIGVCQIWSLKGEAFHFPS